MDKYCKAIELDKILARLAQLCSCEDAKSMALAIEPARDLRDVRELMQYTVDANTLTNRYSTPSVGAVENPAAALKRSEIGARLSPRGLRAPAAHDGGLHAKPRRLRGLRLL